MKCIEDFCEGNIFIYIIEETKYRTDLNGEIVEMEIEHDGRGMPVGMKSAIESKRHIKAEARCDVCNTQYSIKESE